MSQTTISASKFSLGLPAASTLTGTERIAVDQGTYPNAITVFTTVSAIAALAGGSFANPTATIGLTAVNGVATTGMRSDAAPALSQAITPTWTGAHIYTPSGAAVASTINGASGKYGQIINGSAISGQSLGLKIIAGTTNADWPLYIIDQTQTNIYMQVKGDGSGTLGPNATNGLSWATTGAVTIAAPSSGNPLTVNGIAGQYVAKLIGPTSGLQIQAASNSGNYVFVCTNYSGSNLFYIDGAGGIYFASIATTTTAPGAGGAGALPATPAGYVTFSINGTLRKVPYY